MCLSIHFFPYYPQGDTLENVGKELDSIITTGNYLFLTPDTSSTGAELMLEYRPSPLHQFPPLRSSQPSSLEDQDMVNMQRWNSEQISDFVRKLGFLDGSGIFQRPQGLHCRWRLSGE